MLPSPCMSLTNTTFEGAAEANQNALQIAIEANLTGLVKHGYCDLEVWRNRVWQFDETQARTINTIGDEPIRSELVQVNCFILPCTA